MYEVKEMYEKKKVKLKPSLRIAMESLEDTNELLQALFDRIDDSHALYEIISEMIDYNWYLYDKYYDIDIHAGCHNYPNCDEFGCGD
jgi:hypothetical protein